MSKQRISILRLQMHSGSKSKVQRRRQALLPLLLSQHLTPSALILGKEAGLAFERAAGIQTNNLKEPDVS